MKQLSIAENKNILIWEGDENIKQIRALFAPTLSEQEFFIYVEMGKSTGLNPYLKEIWAVKYDKSKAAQIFIGRDGYRKSAQRHPLYDFHSADAVYGNDEFGVDNGKVLHRYRLKDRGELMGGYCIVQRKGSTRATYVFVELKEYNMKQSVWNGKPATMIKKVAEAQALRMAFQELFSGTYSEFEQYEQEPAKITIKPEKGINGLKAKLGLLEDQKEQVIEPKFEELTGELKEDQNLPPDMGTVKFLIESASCFEELVSTRNIAKKLPEDERKQMWTLYKAKEKELSLGKGVE